MYVADGRLDTNAWGLLAITLVAVAGLAFWLIMTVGVAPRRPGRGLQFRGKPPAANQALASQYEPSTPGIPGTPGADAEPMAPHTLSGQHPGAKPGTEPPARPAAATMTGAAASADPRMATTPGVGERPETAVTRDDMPRVPGQRADNRQQAPRQPAGAAREGTPNPESTDMDKKTEEPGVQWTAPAQRRTATDEAVPSRDQSRNNRDRSQD